METGDSRVGESFIGGTMASYSEDDAAQACRIVEGLLGRECEAHDIDENLVISDIEADAHEFSEELDLLDDLDLGVLRSEEHTSELQTLMRISYAVFSSKTK